VQAKVADQAEMDLDSLVSIADNKLSYAFVVSNVNNNRSLPVKESRCQRPRCVP